MTAADESSAEVLRIHLVHGTFAKNAPWTRAGSRFRQRIEARLRELGFALPIEFDAPQWEGRNRHSSRLSGACAIRSAVRGSRRDGAHVRQLLIGHSHGGTACFLAFGKHAEGMRRDGPAAESLVGMASGVVTLSTPFLVFRRAPWVRWMQITCWVAWWMLALFGTLIVTDSHVAAFAVFAAIGVATTAFLYWVLRHGYSDPEPLSVPSSLPLPSLLLRCPGDEASAALGASLIAERILVVTTASVTGVWAWLSHPLRWVLTAFAVGVVVAAATFATMSLTGSLEALRWPAIGVASALALALVAPLLLGLPLRVLLHWCSYGADVAFRGIFLDVTAEPTPPGDWRVHTIVPELPVHGPPALAHSLTYDNEEAIDLIARFVCELQARGWPTALEREAAAHARPSTG